MRIADYEWFDVPPRWTLLRLETADGLVGWGEVSLSRQRRAVHGAIEEFMEEFILGSDPTRIEDHWQRMFRHGRFRGGPVLMTAISGIDMALWDIKGRACDLPVYEFLGGAARDSVRLYQHVHTRAEIAGADDDVEGVAGLVEDAKKQVDAGFTALKFVPIERLRRVDTPAAIEEARERVRAVREAVGPDVDVALDFHGRAAKPMAKQLAVALEEFRPMFYEEAVTGPEVAGNYAELSRHTSVPIATGERRHSRWAFRDLFESGAIDIAQPDLCYAGGISEVRRIAAAAEAYDVMLAPHCPYGPVSLAASLQIDASTPNAIIQEQILHRPDYLAFDPLDYVQTPEVFDVAPGGYVDLPDGPGLGIEVDEAVVRERAGTAPSSNWESPQWRHDDGTVAEW